MLAYDDPQWTALRQAYGTAEAIPNLLRQLEVDPTEAVWRDIWSCLCHQETVYTATYAAVPHILDLARVRSIGSRFAHLYFLGTVAAYHDESSLLDEFRADYVTANSEAIDMCLSELTAKPESLDRSIGLLSSLAGLCGCTGLARSFDGFACDEFLVECPGCATQLYVWPSEHGYRVYEDDPVSNPGAAFELVVCENLSVLPTSVSRSDLTVDSASTWVASLACSSGHPEIADMLYWLQGKSSCPKCHVNFVVYDEITRQAAAQDYGSSC